MTGFVIGLTDGASLIPEASAFADLDGLAVSAARAGYSSGMEATRQMVNNGGTDVDWGAVGAAGAGSFAGDWMGSQVGSANAASGLERNLMQEQAAGGWFGGLTGGYAGYISGAAHEDQAH